MMTTYHSWGRTARFRQEGKKLAWSGDFARVVAGRATTVLPYGFGRSYGDSCLNEGGLVVDASGLKRFLNFDPDTGLLACEAGVSLASIIQFFLPRGWFLPVTPGTKFVSVGGAIANDVHGKNHHVAGTFGRYVRRLALLRSDGRELICSATENAELFRATIGGLGLTGLILWAEIELKAVRGPWIDMESIRFGSLDDFFALSRESGDDYEYTVAWVDCLARGENLGRGLFLRGDHQARDYDREPALGGLPLAVPFDAPEFMLSRPVVQAFNWLYYHRQRQPIVKRTVDHNPFFYPLDAIGHWNRIYGRRGFYQYQFVVPLAETSAVREIFERIAASGMASFLAVLKTFGDLPSPGLMSFPSEGVTLALDFPNQGEATRRLFADLTRIVVESGGRLYPAKDALMSARDFQTGYPNWREFAQHIDPQFSSSFWRRVTQHES